MKDKANFKIKTDSLSYKLKLKGSDEETIRLVLHLEGDGTQYPRIIPITAEEEKAEEEKRKKFIKKLSYYMLAIGLGSIKIIDKGDGTGKKEYGLEQTDKWGGELNTLFYGNKVINSYKEIENWDFEKIKNAVDLKLQDEYLHITKREELYTDITTLLNTVIQKECKGNKNDPVYIDFTKARKEAFKILDIEE